MTEILLAFDIPNMTIVIAKKIKIKRNKKIKKNKFY